MIKSYQHHVNKYTGNIAALKRMNTTFVMGELLSFCALVAFIVCCLALDGNTRGWLVAALAAMVVYFVVRYFDDKNRERIEHLQALLKVYQNEIKALHGDFSPFETGAAFQNPQHAYSFDLDVFGQDSLFQRICRTITTGGSCCLAQSLSREIPLGKDQLRREADLQRELAAFDYQWRMEFLALGAKNEKKIDSKAVVDAMQKVSAMKVPAWFGSLGSLVMGSLLIIGVCASVLLSVMGLISVNVSLWWVMIQYMVVFFVCKKTLDKIDNNGGQLRRQLMAYSQILQLIAQRQFHSELGRQMQTNLAEALPSFAQLEQILKGYDRRGNFLGLFFTDTFMLSDFFLVRSFLKWKKNYMVRMEQWVDIVSELDAAVSKADFRYNHRKATDALLVDEEAVVFEANNLYHPFLGAKAVKNDFCIKDGNFYIVTGANMAGKSTFLRSLGVNYILAMAGMPVFADSLKLSRFRLFSSMRTSDDLTHGISYFNAELLRLEQLLQFCQATNLHTLIILDEILKGTNSVDKLNGSRLFLESIARLPVTGVIATHDLELSKMEHDHAGRFHNYCFEIDLGTDVTYTYKIQPGVARNQNATFLLNKILQKCK